MRIDQIHDRALVLSDYSGVGFGNKVSNRRRVPVITPGHATSIIQTLLHDGPLAVRCDHKAVQVNLKAVGDRIVVDSRRKPTGANKSFAVETATLRDQTQFMRRVSRKPAAAATDVDT